MITGVVSAINTKETKKAGLYVVGLKVGETWFNVTTKYPNTYQKGQTVQIQPKADGSLLNFSDVKVLETPDSHPQQAVKLPPTGANKGEEILKAIAALDQKLSRIEVLLQSDTPAVPKKDLGQALAELDENPLVGEDPDF